jgi:simple sugar transport system permease protein
MSIDNILSWSLIPLTLRLAVPITLGAIGGTFSERSGIINLGLEGIMLIGAFGGVLGVYLTGAPWMGVVFAIIFGGLIGMLHAVISIKFKANQVVSGVGINLFASGITAVLTSAIWGKEGMSDQVAPLKNITIPGLSKIPIIGAFFADQSPFVYITIFVVIMGWYVMYKTKFGLRLRAIGDHPKAAATAGISIKNYRYFFVTLSGVLAGLGGAYLSIAQNNLFVKDMVAGRGFMALAANIFGGWNPLGSFVASIIFALAQALRFNMSGFNIPDPFIQMIPYAVTLLVLIGAGRKTRGPEALGDINA